MAVIQYICIFLCFTGVLSDNLTDLIDQSSGDCKADKSPFIKIGDSYYLLSLGAQVNWFQAVHICHSYDSDLITIETDAEMDAISDYLVQSGHGKHPFWTSGNDLAEEGKYMAISNGRPLSFTRWCVFQPDDGGRNEDCINIWVEKQKFRMNDFPCKFKSYPLCEMRKSSNCCNPLSSCALNALMETYEGGNNGNN